jgi:hypothetical protein
MLNNFIGLKRAIILETKFDHFLALFSTHSNQITLP